MVGLAETDTCLGLIPAYENSFMRKVALSAMGVFAGVFVLRVLGRLLYSRTCRRLLGTRKRKSGSSQRRSFGGRLRAACLSLYRAARHPTARTVFHLSVFVYAICASTFFAVPRAPFVLSLVSSIHAASAAPRLSELCLVLGHEKHDPQPAETGRRRNVLPNLLHVLVSCSRAAALGHSGPWPPGASAWDGRDTQVAV